MATQPLNATLTAEAPLKEQFNTGSQETPKPPTAEEIKAYRKEEINRMKEEIAYLKVKEEYNRLNIAVFEQGVMLGVLPVTNKEGKVLIPGLLGLDLFMKQQQITGEFYQYRANIEEQMKREEAKEQESKEQVAVEPTEQPTDIH